MSISTRKAGTITLCPRCDCGTPVPELEVSPSQAPEQPPTPQADSPTDKNERPVKKEKPVKAAKTVKAEETVSEQEQNQQDEFVPEKTQPEETVSHKTKRIQLASHPNDSGAEELEFSFRKADSEFDDLDMTPMVDVTFLLLIFFMVTASVSIQKSIEVPPPDPDQDGAAQTVQPLDELEEKSILIEIDESNNFFVETETVSDPRDLAAVLDKVRSRESKYEVVISVDERTHHESVVLAIDAAQEVGMQRIRWGVNSND
ncbi:MAG: biopolymer transporter ExbD [Planctomycetaceae bacterium]|nr:biopolymer transporter ExbD [Planctomycetaceae bacterium]